MKRQLAWPRVAQVDAGGPRPAIGEKRFVTSVWATEGSLRLTVFDLGELLLRDSNVKLDALRQR